MTSQIIALWFEPGKCGKDGQNYKITDYLEKEKSFLDEIKSIFTGSEGLSFGSKIIIYI